MSPTRPLLLAALLGLATTAALGSAATFAPLPIVSDLPAVHGVVAVYMFLLPAFSFLALESASRLLGRTPDGKAARSLARFWLVGSVLIALGILFADDWIRLGVLAIGSSLLAVAAGMTTGLMLRTLPKRGDSVVDIARDPLTKGDDACVQQLRFAHFFLPVGTAMSLLAAPWWNWSSANAAPIALAGTHVLLAGYGLFLTYGLSHLWVPRLSGVPAIAAGAIKGELHSSLLGLTLLLGGLLFGVKGFAIAGGAFLFIGCFTFMGVLGANIMRNKSKTARVTPEFVYVPWTFTGVFWLISGVLLGIFLNVVPEVFASYAPGLRFIHVHTTLFGGFALLLIGYSTRLLASWRGDPPPTFQRTKWGFYLVNAGLVAMLAGQLQADGTRTLQVGGALAILGLAACFMTLRDNRRGQVTR